MDEFLNKLEELKGNKTNPFKVPDGYFDSLPSRIQERISSNQKEHSIFSRFLLIVKPQLALAFAFVVFAFITVTTIEYVLDKQPKIPVSTGIYTRIIEVDASEYSEQHFIDVLLDEEKKPNEKKKSTEHYINYLIDEDIDYTTLIDEL
ncbi:MAG: hypothetical protein A2W99_01215 [Bacteroidetes bacterium GWF2_33_16]|nr:MAG: hypothetical protein A2X00_03920 [Bacteroidetes bacterium GWE2_32_14]OFY08878.1 MAG: hypothetical protein A2W99_01215 [Bacteroidetes bacterium GWF2_33_16]